MKRKVLLVAFTTIWVAGIGFFLPSPAPAAYPEKPVKLICTFPAGGAIDLTARVITETVKKHFPKPMVVVNRPGGAGTVGAAEIIQAYPDGYTIGITAVAVLTVQPHRTKLPYASPEDYTPILKVVNVPIGLGVKAELPYKTVPEFVAYAKAHPGKIRVGNPGIGTIAHLNIEQLKRMADIDVSSVPFGGAAEGIPALLGGHIEGYAFHPGDIISHVKNGTTRILGTFEEKRNPHFPEAPTFKELGYDITGGIYFLIIGPKGLSPQIVSTLDDAIKKAMADPVFIDRIKKANMDPSYAGPSEIKKQLLKEYETNAKYLAFLK